METVLLANVIADPNQPRQEFSPDRLKTLVKSIEEKGILSPIMVEKIKGQKDKYLIVDGERRYKAAIQLKLKEIPAIICEAMTDEERMIRRFHVQEQHQSWSPFDKARAIYFFKNKIGLSMYETGAVLGVGHDTVRHWVGILDLSKRNQEYAIERRIGFSYLYKVVALSKALHEDVGKPIKDIQRILLEKLTNSSISDQIQLSAATKFCRISGNVKEKTQFVTDLNMTVPQLLKLTPAGQSIILDKMIYKASCLNNLIIRQQNLRKYLSKKQIAFLEELQEEIGKFIA